MDFSGKMMNVTDSEQALKNYCKSKGYEKPIYAITSRDPIRLDGQTYREKHYVCAVKVNGQHLANGDGFSKRIARKKAAMYGLQNLRVMELNHLFTAFKNHLPSNALEYGGPSSAVPFKSSVQIEEIMTPKPIDISSGTKQKLDRSFSGDFDSSSQELIMTAISKLRSYDCEMKPEPAMYPKATAPPPPPPPPPVAKETSKTKIIKTINIGSNDEIFIKNDNRNELVQQLNQLKLEENIGEKVFYIDDSGVVSSTQRSNFNDHQKESLKRFKKN